MLVAHLPKAIEILAKLLDCDDERVRLAAASEVLDRAIGRARQADSDTEGNVNAMMAAKFGARRDELGEELYVRLLKIITQHR
jgi:hypothetical protein